MLAGERAEPEHWRSTLKAIEVMLKWRLKAAAAFKACGWVGSTVRVIV
jgi:hypothetical protein